MLKVFNLIINFVVSNNNVDSSRISICWRKAVSFVLPKQHCMFISHCLVCLAVCLSVCLSTCIYLSAGLSIYPSAHPSIHPSVPVACRIPRNEYSIQLPINFLSRFLQESCSLFSCLYQSWCHNPVATVSLCLLTQNYQHACDLLMILYP